MPNPYTPFVYTPVTQNSHSLNIRMKQGATSAKIC
jgi:hypothetical protein